MASGDDNPRVDVGITAYRHADFLPEAIESVLAQTLTDWRLTVCDNGPGGGAIEGAVRPYLDDPRIAYRPSGREITLAENWTAAIRGAAPYVGVLNDDDRWHPRFLEVRVQALEAHLDCGFVFSGTTYIDHTGADLGPSTLLFGDGVIAREALARRLIKSNVTVPPTIIVRRRAYEAVGAFFDPICHYSDWEMWARLAARFPAYHLRAHDNDYRRHPLARTSSLRDNPDALVEMLDLIRSRFEREIPGFEVSRFERRRLRSAALVYAASSVFQSGGWRRSWPLYGRALREYPMTLFGYESMQMIGRAILGHRGASSFSRAVRRLARRAPGRRHGITTDARL
jgi:glycosyltransferase involved in cell wall biosynthesis